MYASRMKTRYGEAIKFYFKDQKDFDAWMLEINNLINLLPEYNSEIDTNQFKMIYDAMMDRVVKDEESGEITTIVFFSLTPLIAADFIILCMISNQYFELYKKQKEYIKTLEECINTRNNIIEKYEILWNKFLEESDNENK